MVIINQAPAAAKITASTGGTFQSTAGGNCLLVAPGSSRLEGRAFTIRASGYVSFQAGTYTSAVTAVLYANKAFGATVSASAAIFTTTSGAAVANASVTASIPFVVEADLCGDSVSGLLQGSGYGNTNNVQATRAAIGQAPTSVNFVTEPPISFAVGIVAASNSTAAVLDNFVLEA